MELAFMRCMEEARSILRDAIESAAFARYMNSDDTLQRIWLSKDAGEAEAEQFKDLFERGKQQKLFKGIPELYKQWGRLSETGAHSTPQAIVSRFKIEETQESTRYMMAYTGIEDHPWETETFTLLLTVSMVEKIVFDCYSDRLQFDENLRNLRHRMDSSKEELRRVDHEIQHPTAEVVQQSVV